MNIPDKLKVKRISLTHLGINEVAWRTRDVLDLLDHFENNSIYVLGGDVLHEVDGKYEHNNDSWHFDKSRGSARDSVKKAREYVCKYPEGDYAFVVVVE